MRKELDILQWWVKDVRYASFELNPIRTLPHSYGTNLSTIASDFRSWFGDKAVIFEEKTMQAGTHADHFHEDCLTAQLCSTSKDSVRSICAFWNVIAFAKKVSLEGINNLINLMKKKLRSFRDLYTELWTGYCFYRASYAVEIKAVSGDKELDKLLSINGIEYIVECNKIYHRTATEMRGT